MAITKAENVNGTGGGPVPSVALTTTASVGDVITALVYIIANPHGSGTPTSADVVIHDNVNTGNYTLAGFLWDATNTRWASIHYIVCNASGIPTVSCTETSAAFGTLQSVTRWSGWTGTPTLDAAIGIQATGTSSTIALSPVVTNFNNDLLLVQTYTGSGVSVAPSGYSSLQGGGAARTYYAIEPTASTSAPFSATTSASAFWGAILAGIYDAPAGSTPTVTSVNAGANIAEGATGVAVVGTNFAVGMTSAILQPSVSVAQPFTFTNSTTGSFNTTMEPGAGSQLAFTDSTYTTTFQVTVSGVNSTATAITLVPPSGNIFQTLASINSTSSYRITATPDLVIGDQVEASGNSTGTLAAPAGLTLNSDGTYTFTTGHTPANFWARAYDSVNHVWGAWAEQIVSQSVASVFRKSRRMIGWRIR